MKKSKLILSTLMLALMLAFIGGHATTVYADDPGQGGAEKKAPPPPPPGFWEALVAAFNAAFG
ncbi:MAG TPA: hypothetical protein PLD20_12565 [Blastocatellia bacterium]|nr:hypothetical protein [Blastocatellia bacterium]HMZ18760.1 hypothetical protein [Blastocatellia bacterium]